MIIRVSIGFYYILVFRLLYLVVPRTCNLLSIRVAAEFIDIVPDKKVGILFVLFAGKKISSQHVMAINACSNDNYTGVGILDQISTLIFRD